MTEEIWFIMVVWILLLIVSFKWKNQFFFVATSFVGLFLGFVTLTEVYPWLGLTFMMISLYLLYHSLFRMVKEGKR